MRSKREETEHKEDIHLLWLGMALYQPYLSVGSPTASVALPLLSPSSANEPETRKSHHGSRARQSLVRTCTHDKTRDDNNNNNNNNNSNSNKQICVTSVRSVCAGGLYVANSAADSLTSIHLLRCVCCTDGTNHINKKEVSKRPDAQYVWQLF